MTLDNIAQVAQQFSEAREALENIVKSDDFRESADLYGRFMCSDEARDRQTPHNLNMLKNLWRSGWELSGDDTADGSIHLTNFFFSEDQRVAIPVRWFTDNEAFRAEVIASAAASARAAKDKAARKEVDARAERRSQFLALQAEFAPVPPTAGEHADKESRRKTYEALQAEFAEDGC